MNNIEQIAQFFNDNDSFQGSVKINESLSAHTTMNVGGLAKIFLEPADSESLVFAANTFIEENVNFFVLGGGSNVVVSDDGLDAVISTRKMNGIKFLTEGTECFLNEEKIETPLCPPKPTQDSCFGESIKLQCNFLTLPSREEAKIIQLDCGASWGSVISFCKKNDLAGFEGFTGLSGTVGGALYMNASCFGLSACDNLLSVEYLDLRDMKIHTYEKNPVDWGYKKSPFQKKETTDEHRCTQINGGVTGRERPDRGKTCEASFERVSARAVPEPAPVRGGSEQRSANEGETSPFVILSAKFSVTTGFDALKSEKCLSDRKEKGHFRAPSSGSAFKNEPAHGIIAGKVIDECGLKGFSVGGAQIAPWHGNFIVNPERKATASDVKKLSDEVKKIVFEKTGFALESEILFVSQ